MSEWISVDDRLPAKGEIVALANNDRWMNSPLHDQDGLNWYGVGYLDDASCYRSYWVVIGINQPQCIDSATHWMPMPIVPSA